MNSKNVRLRPTFIVQDDFRIFLELDEFAQICGDSSVVAYLLHTGRFFEFWLCIEKLGY